MRHFYFNFIRNLDSKPLISIIFACLLGGMSLQIMAEDSDNETKTIRVVKVTSQPISSMIFFPGRNAPAIAEALNQSNIPAQINAVLAQLEVKVGQTFNQGDVLARLNCQDQDLEVTNQKAQYDSANEQFKFQKTTVGER
ncbi:MAG: biotin/lipoyl-binding protein [Kangiellaceae bacterium]|nr:biotin/lipoyl-binding protein [Kangiellaceae bacterium]